MTTPLPLRLQICATCRKPQSRPPPCTPPRQMLAIARKWAESQGRALQCEEVSCLSGCAVGLTLLIEHDDASVRLHGIASETELLQVLGEADAVLAGQPSAAVQAHVLSRTDWSQWRD